MINRQEHKMSQSAKEEFKFSFAVLSVISGLKNISINP
jgi:hypothetical protein